MKKITSKIVSLLISISIIPCILIVGNIIPDSQHLAIYANNILFGIEFLYWFAFVVFGFCIFVVRPLSESGQLDNDQLSNQITDLKNTQNTFLYKLSDVNLVISCILSIVIVSDISFVLAIVLYKGCLHQFTKECEDLIEVD